MIEPDFIKKGDSSRKQGRENKKGTSEAYHYGLVVVCRRHLLELDCLTRDPRRHSRRGGVYIYKGVMMLEGYH